MSKARRDADADEEITLVRCKETGRGWIFDKKEAIEDRDEVQSFLGRAEDDGFYVSVGADRRAENRMSGGDGRSITSEESISLLVERHEVRRLGSPMRLMEERRSAETRARVTGSEREGP